MKTCMQLLNDVGTEFDAYAENLGDDSKFWDAWTKLQKRIIKLESLAQQIRNNVGLQEDE